MPIRQTGRQALSLLWPFRARAAPQRASSSAPISSPNERNNNIIIAPLAKFTGQFGSRQRTFLSPTANNKTPDAHSINDSGNLQCTHGLLERPISSASLYLPQKC